jgi:hypothetical protein
MLPVAAPHGEMSPALLSLGLIGSQKYIVEDIK